MRARVRRVLQWNQLIGEFVQRMPTSRHTAGAARRGVTHEDTFTAREAIEWLLNYIIGDDFSLTPDKKSKLNKYCWPVCTGG